jgi:hypothetical protein
MAIAFRTFKKSLNKDCIKKGLMPDFENNYKKLRPFWDEFVQYKLSEKERTRRNKDNTSKKKPSIILAKEVILR